MEQPVTSAEVRRDSKTKLEELISELNCSVTDREKHRIVAEFLSETSISNRASDCKKYFNEMFVFADRYNVSGDSSFPMAYSHLLHLQVGIFESYLATHFRPSDYHCIYIDRKASYNVKSAVKKIVECYYDRFYRKV